MSVTSKWKLMQKDVLKLTSSNIKKLYIKDGLLAIHKPYGIPVHNGPKIKKSISDLFPGLETKYKLPAGSLELVNRLDKNVAGVLLLSYKKDTANRLAELYRKRLIEKTYVAILVGNTKHVSGVLKGVPSEQQVGKQRYKQIIQESAKVNNDAVTKYRMLDNSLKTCMLCSFTSNTGYKHQIRVHASQLLKLPILGDHKYHDGPLGPQVLPLRMLQMLRIEGVKSELRKNGKIQPWQRGLIPLHLFAQRIVIPKFNEGEDLIINSDIPDYFRTTMKNCDLLLNREKADERDMLYRLQKQQKMKVDNIFVSKGVSETQISNETSF